MPVASVGLKSMSLPEFGEPTVMPLVARNTYEARTDALMALDAKAGFDAFAVYGDREHAANVAYLSGYDPRFEETLLVIVPGKRPRLLVGNEGWGYAEICDGPYERVLYQTFSLPAQPSRRPAATISPPTSRMASRSPTTRCARRSRRAIPKPGAASKRGAPSCRMCSASASSRRCCPSPTFRLSFRHFGFRATLR